ncbi:LTA synthase family protein, partial [Pseudomonas syringae pv. tagetis]
MAIRDALILRTARLHYRTVKSHLGLFLLCGLALMVMFSLLRLCLLVYICLMIWETAASPFLDALFYCTRFDLRLSMY